MSVIVPSKRQSPEQKEFCIDVPFELVAKKVQGAKKGDLVLEGYASTFVEDRDGEVVDPHAFDDSLGAYIDTNPILLWQHNQDMPLGNVLSAAIDAKGLKVTATVPKPSAGMSQWKFDAYSDIKRGVVRTFSIGGLMQRELRFAMNADGTENFDVPPQIVIVKVMLLEISTVSIPANPISLFDAAVKSINGAAVGPVVTEPVRQQMAELIGMTKMESEALLAMDDAERSKRFEDLCSLYRRSGAVPPERDAWQKAQATIEKATNPTTILMATLPPLILTLGLVKTGRAGNNTPEKQAAVREELQRSLEQNPTWAKIDAIKELGLAIAHLSESTDTLATTDDEGEDGG